MPEGFFHSSALLSKVPVSKIARCGACKLYRNGCNSPKMQPGGKGKRRIMILGEAPSKEDDAQSRHFAGESGKLLEQALRKFGVDMRKDCILTNSIICKPKSVIPTDEQVSYCRPYLTKALEEYDLDVVIPLGGVAVKSLIGGIWKEDVDSINRWTGFQIPCTDPNVWICPTYHPAAIRRAMTKPDGTPKIDGKVHQLFFEKHIEAAISLKGKPWNKIPDYESQIQKIFNPDEAAKRILEFIEVGRPIAFDFETNALKPDNDDAKIVCASISNGIDTIAFPWKGENVFDAFKLLMRSNLEKYGYNMKFEQRWIKRKLGYEVKNWAWCGMNGAHWRDNRKGITGLKFQAFVLLGAMSYDDAVRPYLKGYKGSKINRIHEITLDQLLHYCGCDSLLEWLVAKKQMKIGNYQYGG